MLHQKIIFPLIYKTRGLNVYENIKELCGLEENSDVEKRVVGKLTTLLQYAYEKSEYYKKVFEKEGFQPESLKSIDGYKKIPVLEKEILRQAANIGLYTTEYKGLEKRETAGSSGKPLVVHIDNKAFSKQLAARYYCFGWFGVVPGDKEARFWGRRSSGIKSKFRNFLLNRQIFTFLGSDSAILAAEAKRLLKFRPHYFYGYSSLILNAAEYWEKQQLPALPLKVIVCTAENLTESQRKYIEKVFGCTVVREYGCTEVDIIAFECEQHRYHVMSDNVYVEQDSSSGELLLTDLNNFTMPIIRYRVGDMAQLCNEICECGRQYKVIKSLQGRTSDQILQTAEGDTIHAVAFAHIFEDLAEQGFEILRFKVLQLDLKKFDVLVECDSNINQESLINELQLKMSQKLGADVITTVKFEDIEQHMGEKYSYFEKHV